jgi:hypothetical protein
LPHLKPALAQIAAAQYNFLVSSPKLGEGMSNEAVLDMCFEYMSISNSIPQEILNWVERKVSSSRDHINEYVLMLTFYVGRKAKEQCRIE